MDSVLVGVDGSACAAEAVRWAVADAVARGLRLVVMAVADLPRLVDVPLSAAAFASSERVAGDLVERATTLAGELAPGLPVETVVGSGDPAAELLRHAAAAVEVVVGSHGRQGLAALLLGSVGAKVAEYAPCTAVVVRGPAAVDGRVVIGVDGSEPSRAALAYGFAYADRHGLPVTALHVYSAGPLGSPLVPYLVSPYPVTEELARLREAAVHLARESVDPWIAEHPGVPVRVDVVEGAPADRLVEASRGAAAVVLGTRGHGGLAGMLLGSVSHAVSRHAHGPVVVAR